LPDSCHGGFGNPTASEHDLHAVLEPHHILLIGAACPVLGSISEAKQQATEELADSYETSIAATCFKLFA